MDCVLGVMVENMNQAIGLDGELHEFIGVRFDIYLADSKIVLVGCLYTYCERRIVLKRLLSRENLYALIFCLIVIILLIITTNQAPTWIYQGF
jgi:hypothetical protein